MREILVYSLGLAGVQMLVSYMNTYQSQFYNSTMGANFTVVAVILLAAKVISAFIDPFIGRAIDRSHFKSGRLRPFVLIGDAAFSVLTLLIFIAVPLSGAAKYVYIFIMILLWSVAMSLTDIPTQGLLSVMSPRADDRNKTAGIANIVKGFGFAGCYVIVPIVCAILGTGSGQMKQKEYLVSTIFMVAVAALFIYLIYPNVKERVPYSGETVTTKEMLTILRDNKPLRQVFISQLLGFGRAMAGTIQVQAAAALFGPVVLGSFVISGENSGVIMGASCAVSSMIISVISPIMNKKIGEKKVFLIFAVYALVVNTIVFVLYLMGLTSPLSLIICLFFVGAGYGPQAFLPLVMIPECADYYELQTGKRTDGIHFAVLSLANKLSTALCVAVGLAMVGLSGYSTGVEITSSMRNIIYAAYVLIPGISSFAAMIPIFGYKLVGPEKERLHAALAQKRAAQTAAAAGSEDEDKE